MKSTIACMVALGLSVGVVRAQIEQPYQGERRADPALSKTNSASTNQIEEPSGAGTPRGRAFDETNQPPGRPFSTNPPPGRPFSTNPPPGQPFEEGNVPPGRPFDEPSGAQRPGNPNDPQGAQPKSPTQPEGSQATPE